MPKPKAHNTVRIIYPGPTPYRCYLQHLTPLTTTPRADVATRLPYWLAAEIRGKLRDRLPDNVEIDVVVI